VIDDEKSGDAMVTRTFHSPTEILMGDSALEVLGERIARVAHQVLVVTDAGIRQTGLLEILQSNIPVSTRVAVFDSVQGNPDTATVEAAVAMAQGVSADLIIALGGGSSIDVAKAAAAVLTNGGRIQDYEGVNRLDRDPLPLIAIPTTVGSGSEVTKGAVITDSGRHVKMIIVSDRLFPRLAMR
jgi:alcohol dehydrogenase